ncbi:MAG: RNA-splicing ligase RtcB [Chloroflexi bacterium]|nr:MAG: RNA-splicing ligase RtcB [Chloroflexota bacterium]HEY73940.1 RtcB family protein [Thermoflexia bacterium]
MARRQKQRQRQRRRQKVTLRVAQPHDFRRVDEYIWELSQSFRDDMRVPARLFGDKELFDAAFRDRTVMQLANAATLPGIVGYAMAMPDFHQGYGFPIGGVAATRADTGVISPGGVGYDINCGVRLLGTHLEREEVAPYLRDLTDALYRACPSGVGGKGRVRVSERELNELLTQGARWALKKGLARQEDVTRTEERGCLDGADPGKVSARAKERGRPQVGSLGAGNHFVEIDVVDALYDPDAADAFGLWEGQVVVQIHCGSRGFGHQVCDNYVKGLQSAVRKYGIKLPDRELVCAPIDSPEGRDYYGAMACAVNYAFVNRQVLAMGAREAFEQVLAGKVKNFDLFQVYDVCHNIAKFEEHDVDGQRMRLCVHRKGATRAFGPGYAGLPAAYRDVGQPVLVPGSMGTASYVLVGTQKALELTFGSTCHGAGRTMSRSKARKQVHGTELKTELERQGIIVRAGSNRGLAEEAPLAYKDVSRVVEAVHGLGIARKVARLRPLGVIKG